MLVLVLLLVLVEVEVEVEVEVVEVVLASVSWRACRDWYLPNMRVDNESLLLMLMLLLLLLTLIDDGCIHSSFLQIEVAFA